MKKEKEFYTSPEVNVFTLQGEGVICQSTGEQVGDPTNWPGMGNWS